MTATSEQPREHLVRVSAELLPELRKWSEPLNVRITGEVSTSGVLELEFRRLKRRTDDTDRLMWCIRRSASLWRREDPEPMVMIAFYPDGQEGFAKAETDGGAISAIQSPNVRLADFDGDVERAIRFLVDLCRERWG